MEKEKSFLRINNDYEWFVFSESSLNIESLPRNNPILRIKIFHFGKKKPQRIFSCGFDDNEKRLGFYVVRTSQFF